MSKIILYNVSEDANHVNKTLKNGVELTGKIKEPCDILHPVFTVSAANFPASSNYLHCTDALIDRYYFIDSITLENDRVIIRCSVDVLMTYRSSILASTQLVTRQENEWSKYQEDSEIPMENTKQMQVIEFTKSPFNITRATADSNNFVLAIAGGAVGGEVTPDENT